MSHRLCVGYQFWEPQLQSFTAATNTLILVGCSQSLTDRILTVREGPHVFEGTKQTKRAYTAVSALKKTAKQAMSRITEV